MESTISVTSLLAQGKEYLEFVVSGGLDVLDMIAGHPIGQLAIAGGLGLAVWFVVKQIIPGQR